MVLGLVLLLGIIENITEPGSTEQDSEILAAGEGFKPGAAVTPQSLANTDSNSIFWAMFRNQIRQPVAQLTEKSYLDAKDYDDPNLSGMLSPTQTRVDYRSRQITGGETSREVGEGENGEIASQARCIGPTNFSDNMSLDNMSGQWRPEGRSSDIDCTEEHLKTQASDGIAPGGLNDQQAEEYIDYIKTSAEKSPISTGKPSLVDHAGKQYVRLPVKITPVKDDNGGYAGAMLFLSGLHHIGLPPNDQLYSNFGFGNQGAEITYFIDPQTTLPAYSFMRDTQPIGDDGKPTETSANLGIQRVQYEFPDKWRPYSLSPEDLKPFVVDWGREMQ